MTPFPALCNAFQSGEYGEVEFVERALETGASMCAIGEQLRLRREGEEGCEE